MSKAKRKHFLKHYDEILKACNEEYTTFVAIGERFDIPEMTMRYYCKKYGIPKPKSRLTKLQDKEQLYNLYIIERRGMCNIAELLNVSSLTVLESLRRHKIPIRDKNEKNAVWRKKHLTKV